MTPDDWLVTVLMVDVIAFGVVAYLAWREENQ